MITVFASWASTRNALHATDYMLPPSRSLYVRLRFEVSDTDLSPAPNEKLLQRQQRTFTLSSSWSGAPSNETDQAWKNLVEDDMGAFSISAKLFQQVNPSLETGVRVPYESKDKYVATFDVVHKLHCLVSELLQISSPLRYLLPASELTLMCQNLIRQSFYPDRYPDYQGFHGHTSEEVQAHREHCIEQIRQSLMCSGDLSILTYNWVKGERMPKPNFKTVHACQNWDHMVGWARENSVEHLIQYIRRPKEGLELIHVPCEEGVDCDGVY
ncbi:tat pathway signal sequence protein [Rutstroemia sp. NJR-2017a BVV2]|nr:tat pathway signal sequence protein [Rutstroemia sp. NJR-2017a BVV2]